MGSLMIEISEIIGLYLPITVGVLVQSIFLLLPVDLRNWNDDLLNVLTYSALQTFVAGVVFIAVPTALEVYRMKVATLLFLLLSVFLLAWIRALKTIPLELTDPNPVPPSPPFKLTFQEFYDPHRLLALSAHSQHTVEGPKRIQFIKERLSRRKPQKADRASAVAAQAPKELPAGS